MRSAYCEQPLTRTRDPTEKKKKKKAHEEKCSDQIISHICQLRLMFRLLGVGMSGVLASIGVFSGSSGLGFNMSFAG